MRISDWSSDVCSSDLIRSLLALADEPERDCAEAAAIARRHLRDIEMRIARLETLRDALADVAISCEGGRTADCRVIEAIAGAEPPVRSEIGWTGWNWTARSASSVSWPRRSLTFARLCLSAHNSS